MSMESRDYDPDSDSANDVCVRVRACFHLSIYGPIMLQQNHYFGSAIF